MPEGFGSFGSDLGGGDVLAPYKPNPIEVAAEQQRRQEDGGDEGFFTSVLKAPGRLFGADSIRGALKGAAENGLSGALEGFARGYGWLPDALGITDHFYRETPFADVMKAWGHDQQSGAADFLINLAGDILTDPSSFVTIFGKVGTAAKNGFTEYASIAKSLDIGERAFLKFKYPFLPAVGVSQFPIVDPLLKTMGFESMSMNIAKGLDNLAGYVRVSPLGNMLRAFSNNLPPVADPEMARAFVAGKNALKEAPLALENAYLQVWAQTPAEAQRYVLQTPAAQRVLREMRERGLTSFDQAHTLQAILDRPAEVVMPASYVQEAGRVAGVGDVRSGAQKSFEEKVAAAGQQQAQVIESARAGLSMDLNTVLNKLKDDPALKTALDGHLVRSADFMRKLGDKEIAEGLINSQLEFYVPRSVTPEARDLINRRVGGLLADAPGGLGATDFMQGRKFTDLTTVEANAVVREIGTRATGYTALKDIEAQAAQEAGWWSKIFDDGFIKQLRKVDSDAADFFRVNPVYADFLRARQSGVRLGQQAFWKQAVSAMSKGEVLAKDLLAKGQEVQQHLDNGLIPVVVAQGKKVEFPDLANFAEEQLGRDVNSRYVVHRSRLRDEVTNVLQGEKADYDFTAEQLRSARDLRDQGPLHSLDLTVRDADDASTRQMKLALAEERDALRAQGEIRDARKLVETGAKGPLSATQQPIVQRATEAAKKVYDDAVFVADQRSSLTEELARTEEALKPYEKGAVKTAPAAKATGMLGEDAVSKDIRDEYINSFTKDDPEYASLLQRREAIQRDLADLKGLPDDARLAQNPKVMEKLVGQKLRELEAEASDRLVRAKTNRVAVRQAISDTLNDLHGDYRQFADSVSSDAKTAQGVLKSMKNDGTHGQRAAIAIAAQRAAARDGMIEFNALTAEQKSALVRNAPDATIHFVSPDDKIAATRYFNELTKPDPLRSSSFVRNLDQLTGIWKGWTVGNGMFLNTRVRDFATGIAMLGFGRGGLVKGSAVVDAMAASRAFRTVMGGGGTLDEVGGKVLFKGVPPEFDNAAKVLKYLTDHGELDSGLVRDEILQSSSDAVKMVGHTKFTDFFSRNVFSIDPKSNPFTRKGYEIANFGDNWVKLAGFLDGLKRGETPEAALQFVRDWTYNPLRDATSFTRYGLRRVFPFAQFALWGIQKTADQLFTAPGTVTWMQKMQDNAARVPPLGGPSVDPKVASILPDFIRDGLGVPYKNTPTGPRYFLFGGYFPAAELAKLSAAVEGIGKPTDADKAGSLYRYIVSQINPFAKVAIEEAANRDSWTGSEISAYEGQTKEMFGVAVPSGWYQTFRQIRILSELDKLNVLNLPQAKLMIDAVDRGSQLDSREPLPFPERLASSVFGVMPRAFQVDASEQVREGRREAQNKQAEMTGRLRNAVERAPAGPKRDANIEALRKELLDAAVQAKSVEDVGREYDVQNTINRKSKNTLAFPRLGR